MSITDEEKARREAQSKEHKRRFPVEDKFIRRSMRRQMLHWMSLIGKDTHRDRGLIRRITNADTTINAIDARRAS